MNVALAAHILSKSVEMSHGYLPSSAITTIQFIDDRDFKVQNVNNHLLVLSNKWNILKKCTTFLQE